MSEREKTERRQNRAVQKWLEPCVFPDLSLVAPVVAFSKSSTIARLAKLEELYDQRDPYGSLR